MSWQEYVDDRLVRIGKVSRAAILGQKGGVWAISEGYELSADEKKAVVAAFTNLENTQAAGVRLAGIKYYTLEATERFIHVKNKTEQAILVAEYKPPIQAPEVKPILEKLAEYLISVNY